MKKIIMPLIVALCIVLVFWIGRWAYVLKTTPQPTYQILEKQGSFEIRKYDPYIIAQVEVNGDSHWRAANNGFMDVGGYIFGNNTSREKVSMTAPVIASEKIAMTAPVTAQNENGTYRIAFIMPPEYKSVQDLPVPNNERVKLIQKPEQVFATKRYSWLSNTTRAAKQTTQLESWMKEKELKALAPPIQAYYNEPWAPPFLRRNEILIETKHESL